MEISKAEYQRFVQDRAKKSPLVKDCAMAFGIGGVICVIGQLIMDGFTALGLDKVDAGTATSVSLVLLSALLTGLNLYNKLGRYGGGGPWCPSPALPTRWSPRPSTSRARALSPAWRRRCSPWPGP